MNPRDLSRLHDEQNKAFEETNARIEQWEQFKSDYKAVQKKLKTLPDKMSYDVMVPFGKVGFMPGKIVHTNEILVLLGDNWFVERSAKQAAEIAQRRIKALDTNLKDLKEQKRLLESRLSFTTELNSEIEGQSDVKEIVEEYDEEKERLWNEKHKESLRRYHEQLRKGTESCEKKKDETIEISDQDLWDRLDQLERQETERGEMDSSCDSSDEVEDTADSKAKSQRVVWQDEKLEGEAESSGGDYSDDEDTDVVEESRISKVIHFTHTKTPAILPHQVSSSGDASIHSPGDIYKLFSPKSILKKGDSVDSKEQRSHKLSFKVPTEAISVLPVDRAESDPGKDSGIRSHSSEPPVSSVQKAFTGLVVETSNSSSESKPDTMDTSATQGPRSDAIPKRVSKFKAQRLKQSPE